MIIYNYKAVTRSVEHKARAVCVRSTSWPVTRKRSSGTLGHVLTAFHLNDAVVSAPCGGGVGYEERFNRFN